MARKTLTYTVSDEGRDKGKVFVLTEMPATQAERWAVRAFLAMSKNGIEIPDGAAESGWAAVAKMGVSMIGRMHADDAIPLLDEMMGCVKLIPNPGNTSVVRSLVEDDIEEVATRLKLRVEVFKLHADFSRAAAK